MVGVESSPVATIKALNPDLLVEESVLNLNTSFDFNDLKLKFSGT